MKLAHISVRIVVLSTISACAPAAEVGLALGNKGACAGSWKFIENYRMLLDFREDYPYDLYRKGVQQRLGIYYSANGRLSGKDLRRELRPDIPRLEQDDRNVIFGVAKWLAWLSANAYVDDFGHVSYPGALFATFRDMGFGYDGEEAFWIGKGLELRDAIRKGDKSSQDVLERELFTQLCPTRGLGKLHATLIDKEHFEQGSTQVYFLHDPRRALAVVVFRGTQRTSREDVLRDLDWKPVRYEDGVDITSSIEGVQVYQGFRRALWEPSGERAARDILLERLALLPTGTRLYVTGHSLGGALANLFTYALLEEEAQNRPYRVVGLFTFGSPAVGNEPFARALNERMRKERTYHARFVLEEDPVTRMPSLFRWLHRDLSAYRHATDFDPGDVSQTIRLRLPEDRTVFSRPRFISRWFASHKITHYFTAIHEQVTSDVSTKEKALISSRDQ